MAIPTVYIIDTYSKYSCDKKFFQLNKEVLLWVLFVKNIQIIKAA